MFIKLHVYKTPCLLNFVKQKRVEQICLKGILHCGLLRDSKFWLETPQNFMFKFYFLFPVLV